GRQRTPAEGILGIGGQGAAARRGNIGAPVRARRVRNGEASDLGLVDLTVLRWDDDAVGLLRPRDPPDGDGEVTRSGGRRRDGGGDENRGDQGVLDGCSPVYECD